MDRNRLERALATARGDLLAERNEAWHWVGELASSALSTATALSALALMRPHWQPETVLKNEPRHWPAGLIDAGVRWLVAAQNTDGGWGDTDRSLSNISTTMLVEAAFHLTGAAAAHAEVVARAREYLTHAGGIPALRQRYGDDKTFAVPILTNCALAGLVPWSEVSPLPFEAACLPQSWYRLARLPVVSYAIPALVAIGQARFFHAPPRNPLLRALRRLAVPRSLRVLERMQPASGGFLEATPLTSFVVMSLASIGQADNPVARQGTEFLLASVRPDGSWPIDSNLATWVTTLAVNALGVDEPGEVAEPWASGALFDWLLGCQHRERHPFTGAAPGGWGWSDLSGAVPDADDTPGALLAIATLRSGCRDEHPEAAEAVRLGIDWLLGLQNGDGGWPTFCRGWGTLPFDRSGSDLTAHSLRALHLWRDDLPSDIRARIGRAIARGLRYIARTQRPDGSWLPLWFGNQYQPDDVNPVYGTARVLLAYRDLELLASEPARRGFDWLVTNQNADGGWGGGPTQSAANHDGHTTSGVMKSSVEETALAVEALCADRSDARVAAARERAVAWLVDTVEKDCYRECSPIGFYFAKLWYYERLYPLIFTVSALGQAVNH